MVNDNHDADGSARIKARARMWIRMGIEISQTADVIAINLNLNGTEVVFLWSLLHFEAAAAVVVDLYAAQSI